MENLILIGAGGYAKSVLDSIDYYNYKMAGFIDEYKLDKKTHLGYPLLGHSLDDIEECEKYVYFICIGNNDDRKIWYDRLTKRDLRIINVIDGSAIISRYAKIGNGCFIGKMAIVNSNAVIEDNSIVNTKALVEHGCHIGMHTNVSTNTVINGDVTVGEGGYIGSCSVINGQKKIGEWAIVGSGAVVISDIDAFSTNVGVPAVKIKENKNE